MLAMEYINIIQTWEFNNTSEHLLKYLQIDIISQHNYTKVVVVMPHRAYIITQDQNI